MTKEQKGAAPEALHSTLPGDLVVSSAYFRDAQAGADAFPTNPAALQAPGWRIAQHYHHPDAELTADRFAADRRAGVRAGWFQVGLERGVRVLSAGDLDTLLGDTPLDDFSLFWEAGAETLGVAAAIVAVAEARGLSGKCLTGCWGMDPLSDLLSTGSHPAGWKGARADMRELVAWAREDTPGMRPVLVSAAAAHDAGAALHEELGWSLACGAEYVRVLVEGGIHIREIPKLLQLSYAIGPDVFPEVAKLRAARALWARLFSVMGVAEKESALPVHACSSGRHDTYYSRYLNILRASGGGVAAILGGADTVSIRAFDEPHGGEGELASRVARNAHFLMRDEAHLGRVSDPAAGSFYVETLTQELCQRAWDYFQAIEAAGGGFKYLISGELRRSLESRERGRARDMAKGRSHIVGANAYANLQEEPPPQPEVDLRDVEARLGRELLGAASQEAIMEFAATFQAQDAPVGTRLRAAVGATGAGVDVFSVGTLFRAGSPSVHVEPPARRRLAESWEHLRGVAESWHRARGERFTVYLVSSDCEESIEDDLGYGRQLCEALGLRSEVYGEDSEPLSGECAALAVFGKQSDTERLLARVEQMLGVGCRSVGVFEPTPGLQKSLIGFSSVHFLFQGATLLRALEELLRDGGLRR